MTRIAVAIALALFWVFPAVADSLLGTAIVRERNAPPPPGLSPPFPGLTVLRFVNACPGESCPRPEATADLTNTYWRITAMQGEPAPRLPSVREAHLILRSFEGGGFVATVGCNRLIGEFSVEGDSLTLTAGATTRMACPPPLDNAEERLLAVLEATRGYRIAGQRLQLLDAANDVLAALEAVYLR